MRVLILLACVAYAAAIECGPLQRLKVKNNWGAVFASGQDREAFAREFWSEFFREDPEARALFGRVRGDNIWSPEFQAHALRVLGGLDMSISLLSENDVLEANLSHLQAQHVERNVGADDWELFVNSLIVVLGNHEVGQHLDADAWRACANVIVAGIRG